MDDQGVGGKRSGSDPVRVSVVIINHNYEEYVGQAIDSVLAQERPPYEVLVVDDGSTDQSLQVIRSYQDRVRTLFKENGGNSSVVNAAVPTHLR